MSVVEIQRTRNARRVRPFVTPEGVDLQLVLADASERASAFLLDVVFIVLGMVGLSLVTFAAAMLFGFSGLDYLAAFWLLGFFLLRNFYFAAFEMTPRAATPGKRILGIRVTTRDGSALTADSIFARNAMRELEIFLPMTFFVTQADAVDGWITILALVWCSVFVFFPLFNKDRLRIGDLIAGTWVVMAPRRVLAADLAERIGAQGLVFTPQALNAYGIRELSVLEEVLRKRDPLTVDAVARRIRSKIAMTDDRTPDADFLSAYYTALRGRLESRLLFGRRKRDKFDTT